MKVCPRCGSYMSPYLESICGNTYTMYTCPCGYKTRHDITTAGTSTNTLDIKSLSNNTVIIKTITNNTEEI